MAYSINQNDVIEITYQGVISGQTVMTVLHYAVDTAPPANDAFVQLLQFCDDLIAGNMWTNYKALVGTDWQSRYVVAQVINPVRRPRVVRVVVENGTGGAAAETPNLAAVVTKRTDVVTQRKLKVERGGTGGVHIPALPKTQYALGLLLPAYKVLVNDWCDDMITPRNIGVTGAVIPCLFHRGQLSPSRFDYVVQANVQDTVRVMRRRTVGLGI